MLSAWPPAQAAANDSPSRTPRSRLVAARSERVRAAAAARPRLVETVPRRRAVAPRSEAIRQIENTTRRGGLRFVHPMVIDFPFTHPGFLDGKLLADSDSELFSARLCPFESMPIRSLECKILRNSAQYPQIPAACTRPARPAAALRASAQLVHALHR